MIVCVHFLSIKFLPSAQILPDMNVKENNENVCQFNLGVIQQMMSPVTFSAFIQPVPAFYIHIYKEVSIL